MRLMIVAAAVIQMFFWALAPKDLKVEPKSVESVRSDGNTIATRFVEPINFTRAVVNSGSYEEYLRNLPLKEDGALVHYYNGQTKTKKGIYCAVVDMDIDPVDLQQCADAVMRLRGEYLFQAEKFDDIHFNFLSDGKARYFKDYAKGDLSYKKFRKYMKYIFSYANTRSLADELEPDIAPEDIAIGDVFVQKGNPYGHAVIVLDMVWNGEYSEKKFLLGQSYMPAQETQILVNPLLGESPWYSNTTKEIVTPEWTFQWKDLKRFPRKSS